MLCNITYSNHHSLTTMRYAEGIISAFSMHITKSITTVHSLRHKKAEPNYAK